MVFDGFGYKYDDVHDMCQNYHIKESEFWDRINRGMPLQRALQPKFLNRNLDENWGCRCANIEFDDCTFIADDDFGYIYIYSDSEENVLYVGQTIKSPVTRFKQHIQVQQQEFALLTDTISYFNVRDVIALNQPNMCARNIAEAATIKLLAPIYNKNRPSLTKLALGYGWNDDLDDVAEKFAALGYKIHDVLGNASTHKLHKLDLFWTKDSSVVIKHASGDCPGLE